MRSGCENLTAVLVPAASTHRSLVSIGHIPSSRSVIEEMKETRPVRFQRFEMHSWSSASGERRSAKMICVSVEIREGELTYRARVTTSSIGRALEIMGGGKPCRRVRLLFPIDPEVFFISAPSGTRRGAV